MSRISGPGLDCSFHQFRTENLLKMSHKLELKYARSQRELADIVEERDRYIKKYNEARMLLVETQTREESAQCEIQDLRRQLRRYHDDMVSIPPDKPCKPDSSFAEGNCIK